MQIVILAGGMQSSINNNHEGIPKPMIEIGGKPLLWHIMKYFSSYGLNEFIICGGYRVDMIKEYFMDYYIYASDITIDLQSNKIEIHKKRTENWKVTVVDTGLSSTTGQRIRLIQKYIQGSEFIVTFGDCLFDIDINSLIETYNNKRKIATVAVAKPTGRNELLPIDKDGEIYYTQTDSLRYGSAWVNANCYVFDNAIFQFLNEKITLETLLFGELSQKHQVVSYKHTGFWKPIETKRDLVNAEQLWSTGKAPWRR